MGYKHIDTLKDRSRLKERVEKQDNLENVSNYDSSKKSHCSVVEARDNKDTFEGGHLPFTTESTRKQQE